MAITSAYTLGPTQVDGRTPVIETHISDLHPGKVVRKEYLVFIDPQHPEYVNPVEVMQLRAAHLTAEESATGRAAALAAGGSFGLNKYEFRKLFTAEERPGIDAFIEGGYLTHPALTEAQKIQVGDGVRAYNVTPFVEVDNPDTILMVNMFEALGLIAAGRAAEILNGQ